MNFGNVQLGREVIERPLNTLEYLAVVVDEVHLVHAQDKVMNLQERSDVRVSIGLLHQTVTRVDQHDGQIRSGGAGHHIARVLHVSRGVGDDEFALRRGEVLVRHIDGNSLLALGPQAVREQRQVHAVIATLRAAAF
jgi:hypothetical protein